MSKTKKAMEPVCNCPPNSPFLLACRRADPALVAALQTSARASKASSQHVTKQRAAGNDVGFIPGISAKSRPLVKPAFQMRSSDATVKRQAAKERTAQALKPARHGISIPTQADSDKSRRIRKSGI